MTDVSKTISSTNAAGALPHEQWRCPQCGALLGVVSQGVVHIKVKSAQYFAQGAVRAICRRCGRAVRTPAAARDGPGG